MNFKVTHIILLFTLLSVAGQLVAFNQHCDMTPEASTTSMLMSHGDMQHQNHEMAMEQDSVMQSMPCCDMATGCDMASCIALMLNSSANSSELHNQSKLVIPAPSDFRSFENFSFYKPPIFS